MYPNFVCKTISVHSILTPCTTCLVYNAQLTQEQVLAKLNVMGIQMTKSTYAKIETNRMNIKVSELVAFAKILDTDFNVFFKGL